MCSFYCLAGGKIWGLLLVCLRAPDVYLEMLWSPDHRLFCFHQHLLAEHQIITCMLMWVVVLICSQSQWSMTGLLPLLMALLIYSKVKRGWSSLRQLVHLEGSLKLLKLIEKRYWIVFICCLQCIIYHFTFTHLSSHWLTLTCWLCHRSQRWAKMLTDRNERACSVGKSETFIRHCRL